jgi:hypothetical protein
MSKMAFDILLECMEHTECTEICAMASAKLHSLVQVPTLQNFYDCNLLLSQTSNCNTFQPTLMFVSKAGAYQSKKALEILLASPAKHLTWLERPGVNVIKLFTPISYEFL